MDGECGMQWENRNAISVLVGKLEGQRALAGTVRKLENNIKMELQEMGWQGSNWLDLAHGRDMCQALMNAIKDLRIPLNAGKFLTEKLLEKNSSQWSQLL